MKTTDEIKQDLTRRLMILRPARYLAREVRSVSDIFEHRHYLRDSHCSPNDLKHLLGIVLAAVEGKKRFRQLDCLKVLKRIIKSRFSDIPLSPEITDKLFAIYKNYIFSSNEEIQWAVSVFLKGRLLRNEQIRWLVEHYSESKHIVNRLLRYPVPDDLIRVWATTVLSDPTAMEERRAELVAILITNEIPKITPTPDSKTFAWAVFYASLLDKAVKTRLLKSVLDSENLDDVAEVATRSNLPDVLEFILEQLEKTPKPV